MNLTEDDNLCIRCFDEPSNDTLHREFGKTFDVMYVCAPPVDPVIMFEFYKEFSLENYVCNVCGFS
jgi:hypothetical protein